MRKKACRSCGKYYEVPSEWAGCCSSECKRDRRIWLATHKLKVPKKKKRIEHSKAFFFSKEWKELRYYVLRKYSFTCLACGRKPPSVILHVDHIKPRSRHPHLALKVDNLQVLCSSCNEGKSDRFEDDLRQRGVHE